MLIIAIYFLIAVLTVILGALASSGDIYNKAKKKPTKLGWWYYSLTVFLIILVLFQILLQKKIDEKKERNIAIQQQQRDSSLKSKYDSSLFVLKSQSDTSNFKFISIISETLGKYGYKLDSSTKSLKKVIADSSKTRVKESDDPVLTIGNGRDNGIKLIRHKNGYFSYSITFYSNDAGSSRFLIKCSTVIIDSASQLYLNTGKIDAITYKTVIAKNSGTVAFHDESDVLKYNYLLVWLRGSYKNLDGTKEFFVNEVYYNNLNGNVFGTMKGLTAQKVRDAVNQHEK